MDLHLSLAKAVLGACVCVGGGGARSVVAFSVSRRVSGTASLSHCACPVCLLGVPVSWLVSLLCSSPS